MTRMELLAPAGSLAALHAAVRAGADAVYLGLDEFNARRGAENFTLETLPEVCDWAHLRGVKVYVAMNTVILPREIDPALEKARQAWRAGADAFIVQDLGLASAMSRALPQAQLHISTQMNIHNEAGIRACARLGATRVTLARELSVEEIANLAEVAANWGMEVEAFGHGAICVCYSGQCFMSSMIGGRSANRGMCAQACRLPYQLECSDLDRDLPSPGEHLLSPKDLCSVDLLSQLAEAGCASLKVEGRMKSADYVYAVVSTYRAVLDRVLASAGEPEEHATEEERRVLEEAFSRGFTTAYMEGARNNGIMSYQRPNNRGAYLGRVSDVSNGRARIAAEYPLFEGDVLEFWTGRGRVAQTVGTIDGSGKNVTIRLDEKTRGIHKGDRVFRVRSAQAAVEDSDFDPRIPVTCKAQLRIGQPLRISFELDREGCLEAGMFSRLYVEHGDATGLFEGPVVEAARTKAVTKEDVFEHIDRLGNTAFVITGASLEVDDGVGIGFSQIHKARAAALEDLRASLLASYKGRKLERQAKNDSSTRITDEKRTCTIAAFVTNPNCSRLARKSGATELLVSALNYKRGGATVAGVTVAQVEQAGYPKQAICAIPAVEHDLLSVTREGVNEIDVWEYAQPGKMLLVDSFGAMQRAGELGCPFQVGPHVPLTNREALAYAAELGAVRVWLSPELTLAQIGDLAKDSPVELGLIVSGACELMITEHCLLMSQGECDEQCAVCKRRSRHHSLRDRKGFEFPVMTDILGRSHLFNSVALDIVPAIPDLLASGVTAFAVDATLLNGEQTAQAVGRLVRAVNVAQKDGNSLSKMPDTTSGHLYRGVS